MGGIQQVQSNSASSQANITSSLIRAIPVLWKLILCDSLIYPVEVWFYHLKYPSFSLEHWIFHLVSFSACFLFREVRIQRHIFILNFSCKFSSILVFLPEQFSLKLCENCSLNLEWPPKGPWPSSYHYWKLVKTIRRWHLVGSLRSLRAFSQIVRPWCLFFSVS
jgi:hypothetical protein